MAKRRSSRSVFPGKRRIRKLIILILTVFFGVGGGLFLRGKVVYVSDGDTLTIVTQGGSFERIRLYGVDCPESQQSGGKAAADFASGLALFQEATYEKIDTDRYGRAVAIVTLPDGHVLNQELVRSGHAWVYRDYCKNLICASWAVLEAEARREQRGLWQEKKPTAPWKWRAARR